jgi:HAD superfamily hydrolase (TIGR01509 family)
MSFVTKEPIMPNYRVLILDVDGTLIDSNDAHAWAYVRTFDAAGHAVPFERIRRMIGMGGDHVLPEVTGLSDESDEGKQISKQRGEIFKQEYLPTLKAFPQVRPLMEKVKAQGLKLVIATSAKEDELGSLLKVAGIGDLIEQKATSDDAEESKPAPDIVAAALKRSGVSAREAVMLGDTPYDVSAARKAGVDIIAVRCGGWADADLKGAIAIYDDPANLLAHYDQSPLA